MMIVLWMYLLSSGLYPVYIEQNVLHYEKPGKNTKEKLYCQYLYDLQQMAYCNSFCKLLRLYALTGASLKELYVIFHPRT